MSHRIKGRHKPRHHIHAVKPNFSSVLKPFRIAVEEVVETPAAEKKEAAKKADTLQAEPASV